jgi:ketosteroid isomerase-like protein
MTAQWIRGLIRAPQSLIASVHRREGAMLGHALVATSILVSAAVSAAAAAPINGPLDGFNHAFADAFRKMDNKAVLALWEDDGIALLPHTPPVIGKAQIARMMGVITSAHPKAHMESFTNECSGVEPAGDWASEWCLEHQVVVEPGQKPFDGWGKMLLILHRGRDRQWRLNREMWNEADAPNSKP